MHIHTSWLVPVQVPGGVTASVGVALGTPNAIKGTPAEVAQINSALQILNNPANFRPSVLGNIEGQIFPFIQQLDNVFNQAIESYKKQLVNAAAKDAAQAITLIADPNLYAMATGVARITTNHAPNIPVIREIAYPFLAIFGFFWGIHNKEKIIKEKYEEDKSINRKKWAHCLEVSEEKRIEDSIKLIKIRVSVLVGEIVNDDQAGIRNSDHVDELMQIASVIQVISNKPLLVSHNGNEMVVQRFLEGLQ